MARSDVLIIGAGPTGLVLALWLTKLGVKVRIVDKTAEPGTTSRPWRFRHGRWNFTGSWSSSTPLQSGATRFPPA
jgi:2-polyprenyl-6-methoxyphenol hydroxylase-like FAD-dependent oxidoreductase